MHLTGFHAFLAQAAPGGPATGQPGLSSLLIPMVLFFVMIYFLMIRPQNQQRKQQMKLQDSLKAGDKVVTASGIVGTVISVKEKTVSLRSMDAKMEVTRGSITDVLERSGEDKAEKTVS